MLRSRARARKSRRRSLTVWASLFVLLLGVGLYSAGPLQEAARESLGHYVRRQAMRQPPPEPVFTPGLSVKEFAVKPGPSGDRVVAGILRNTGAVAYPYVEVRMDLQNAAGKKIGSTLAEVRDIRPGHSAAFTAPAPLADLHHVTLAEIRGYR
jgi:hypothetical protein